MESEHDVPPLEPSESQPPVAPNVTESATQKPKRSATTAVIVGIAIVLVAAFGASQVYLMASLSSTRGDITALEAQVAGVEDAVTEVDGAVAELSVDIASAPQASTPAGQGVSPAPAVPEGYLPRFTNGAQDTALGLTLAQIAATDAYAQEAMNLDPADGTKRVWLIWAHWCPYCQQELPELATWYPDNAARFPNSEFVTVTTSMDPARGNPLDEYLATEQFPFPVLIDEDQTLAARFGVSAFPFWVVTNGDGTVLYRTAGLIGVDAVEQLFTQLEQIGA
jgi:thiol-disulfide isomerase/thioredoxin